MKQQVRLQALTIEYKENGIREGKFDIFSIDKEEENKSSRNCTNSMCTRACIKSNS